MRTRNRPMWLRSIRAAVDPLMVATYVCFASCAIAMVCGLLRYSHTNWPPTPFLVWLFGSLAGVALCGSLSVACMGLVVLADWWRDR